MPHPKGGYRLKNRKKVPGVTTIIGRFKDSGGLLWWAFDQGKAAERGEINSLYDKRDEAAESGTLAHELVEKYINGEGLYALKKQCNDPLAWQGFENYLTWEKNSKIKIIEQEMELVSEIYCYGGCLDGIGEDTDKRLCLIDWKTSNRVYQDHIIQLAAYKHLWEINNPDKPITGGFHLCRFSKEHADFTHHYWAELDDAWEQFKLFRTAYDLDKRLKKRTG